MKLSDIVYQSLSGNASQIVVGPHRLFMSYGGIVGYAGPSGTYRLDDALSKTTLRHLESFGFGGATRLDPKEFADLLASVSL